MIQAQDHKFQIIRFKKVEKYKKIISLTINQMKIWILRRLVQISWVDQKLNLLIQNQLNRGLKQVRILQNQWLLRKGGLKFYLSEDLWLLLIRILLSANKRYKIDHQQKNYHRLNRIFIVKIQKARHFNQIRNLYKLNKKTIKLFIKEIIKKL